MLACACVGVSVAIRESVGGVNGIITAVPLVRAIRALLHPVALQLVTDAPSILIAAKIGLSATCFHTPHSCTFNPLTGAQLVNNTRYTGDGYGEKNISKKGGHSLFALGDCLALFSDQ